MALGDHVPASPGVDEVPSELVFCHVGDRFEIRPLARREAVRRVVQSVQSLHRFAGPEDQADFLGLVTTFVQSVDVFELQLSPDLAELDRLVDHLGRDRVMPDAPTIRLLGADDRASAFSVINASWRRALLEQGAALVDDGCADLLVHHDYSARFGEVALPASARRVAVRPWDFGPYPGSWAEIVARDYDELWVFTTWGRHCAIAGGVPPERVRVVPLGVDAEVFNREGPTHEMTHGAGQTFLFVGAATDRKGIDILLRAFVAAFDARSDVQLVVKDHTGDAFYTGLSRRDAVLEAAREPGAPRIRYVDGYLARSELAALYRGATALVLPSRAEGWALPVLEAMACGTPAVVPSFGAFLDYCTNESSVLVDTRRIRLPVGRTFAYNTLGYEAHVESVDFCETAPEVLASALRDVASEGKAASERRSGAAVDIARVPVVEVGRRDHAGGDGARRPHVDMRLRPLHEQLSRIALGQDSGDIARACVRRTLSLDATVDPDVARLMPLVFQTLQGSGADSAELAELRRFARSSSADNQLLFRHLEHVLAVLASADVEAMVLKGVPLALLHYPRPGLRPMSDFDVLVRPRDAPTALAAVTAAGWEADWMLRPDFVVRGFEVPCSRPGGESVLDLHWRLVPWVNRDGSADDTALWSSAVPLAIGGQRAWAPAPDDLVLHVILHAYRAGWDEVPRWVTDVVLVLRTEGDTFAWDRFVDRVSRGHLAAPVLEALRYVATEFQAPVPDAVLRRLTGEPTRRELYKHHLASRPIVTERDWLFGETRDLRTAWARASINLTRRGAASTVGPFLRLRTNVDRLAALPFAVVARRARRTMARAGRAVS